VWMLGLVALLAIGSEPQSAWDRLLLGVVGLAFCVEGIDAIRTARAEFRFSMWYGFEATRREQPVRYWIYCVLNFTIGGWVLAVSVFSVIPSGQVLSTRYSTSHGIVGVVPARAFVTWGRAAASFSESRLSRGGIRDDAPRAELLAASAGSNAPSIFTWAVLRGRAPDSPSTQPPFRPRCCSRRQSSTRHAKQRPNRRLQPTAAGAIMSRRG
jgi:hypothetical protein